MLTVNEIKQQATHAFRAETQSDIGYFLVVACESHPTMRLVAITVETDESMPGLYFHTVFIETEASVAYIRDRMRKIPDAHVMRQTLAITAEYTGERDWSVE